MLRVGRRGLLARLGVKSPQLSWNGFTSQRGVSVFNGIGNGLQSSQSHSPFIFTNGLIGGPLEHVFSHNLRAFAAETPKNGGDYSTDPVVVGLARDDERDRLEKLLRNYYTLDETQAIREAQRLIDVHKEITHAQVELPTQKLEEGVLEEHLVPFSDLVKDVEAMYAERKAFLSSKHGIDINDIDGLLPPDCKGAPSKVNFHLRGLSALSHDSYQDFCDLLKGPRDVVGIFGPKGCSKTSTALSLAHSNQRKESETQFVIYITCNGNVPDPNYATLRYLINNRAKPLPSTEWKDQKLSDVAKNLADCDRAANYWIQCDVLSRLLLLKFLIDENPSVTPIFHQKVEFSTIGSRFCSRTFEFLRQFDPTDISDLLTTTLDDIDTILGSGRVVVAIDEAQRAAHDFDDFLSVSVVQTEIPNLYKKVCPNNLSSGDPSVVDEYRRGIIQYYYFAVYKHLPFVALGTGLEVQDVTFVSSGEDAKAQTTNLAVVDHFHLLTQEDVRNHLSEYPPFNNILESIDESWNMSTCRRVELALYDHYNNKVEPLAALNDARAKMQADIQSMTESNLRYLTEEELFNILSNTSYKYDFDEYGSQGLYAESPTKQTIVEMENQMKVKSKVFKCGLSCIKLNQGYALVQPEYIPKFTEKFIEILKLKSTIKGSVERERILCIDGGGSAGIVPIRILHFIEKHLSENQTLSNLFDRLVGASAGGITSLALMSGFNCDELTNAYLDILSRVWVDGSQAENAIVELLNYLGLINTHERLVGLSEGAGFERTKLLQGAVKEKFIEKIGNEDCLLKPLEEMYSPVPHKIPKTTAVAVFAENKTRDVTPIFFSNYKCDNNYMAHANNILTATAATSAIDYLFGLSGSKEGKAGKYFDGGYLCNNPSWKAFEFSYRDCRTFPSAILSLGCGIDGAVYEPDESAFGKVTDFGKEIVKSVALLFGGASSISARLNTNAQLTHLQMLQTFGNPSGVDDLSMYYRINPILKEYHVSVSENKQSVEKKLSKIDEIIDKQYGKKLESIIKHLER